jgi:hypothetical protein
MKAKLLAIGFLLGLAVSSSAGATLLSAGDVFFGADSVVRDTATNSDWLKPSLTNDISRATLTGLLATDPGYSGWRFATQGEVTQLFLDGGVPLVTINVRNSSYGDMRDYSPGTGYSAADLQAIAIYNQVSSLGSLLGYQLSGQSTFVPTVGNLAGDVIFSSSGYLNYLFDSAPGNPIVGFGRIETSLQQDLTTGNVLFTKAGVDVGFGAAGTESGSSFFTAGDGSYLVRDSSPSVSPVPEPGTCLLVGVGLIAIVLMKRSRVA